MISIISVIDERNALGYQGHLLYDIPQDRVRFKSLTMGQKIIMGHSTYNTLPPLPGREEYVLSRDKTLTLPDAIVLHSLEEVVSLGRRDDIWIIGGGQVYNLCIGIADLLYITRVHSRCEYADTFFPIIDSTKWYISSEEVHIGYTFQRYVH